MARLSLLSALSCLALSLHALAGPLVPRQNLDKPVFAHFIVGIVASYERDTWDQEIRLAKETGIDGFALNIGKDDYNDRQLTFAYEAAQAANFKMFLSFDFSIWQNNDIGLMIPLIQKFSKLPAQFFVNNKAFVSSFIGDGFAYRDLEAQSGTPLFACPFWQPFSYVNNNNADCGLAWTAAWPNNQNNPIDANITTDADHEYIRDLAGRPYMMPVSPWFNTHFGPDTFNKNFIFYSDWLWQDRWDQVLQIKPQFVEIATWNDFGESHYIGPLHPEKPFIYAPNGQPNGAIRWVDGFPHDGWRDLASVYIKAYKAGASAPTVTDDELIFYYRPNPKNAGCSDAVTKPTGAEFPDDAVYVTAMLTSPGTVVITSGGNPPFSVDLPAGVNTVAAPMGVGAQTFTLSRGGNQVMTGTGGLQISNECSVNNFNAFVGTVKR